MPEDAENVGRRGRLAGYRRGRDFAATPEPAGEEPAHGDHRLGVRPGPDAEGQRERHFVVHHHRARRPHYDLRLELDGALVSWAVPKGPTLDPHVRHAAFHVEDHPLEYLDFEGVIPAGGYGAGDVIVWDTGTWHFHPTGHSGGPGSDPTGALAGGELHFDLRGQKLRGRFVLVRTRTDPAGREEWLLLHKQDEFAVAGWDPREHPRSVLSGRTNDEVRAHPERVWRADRVIRPASADELRELDAITDAGSWHVFGRALTVTNLDKVFCPPRAGEPPVTKRDLLRYAAQVAPTVVPYLRGRAFHMHRFPDGTGQPGFWHKEAPHHAPAWLSRWDNPEAGPGTTGTYLVVDEPAALVWVTNFGSLEWHAWTSPVAHPHQPSYALVDLDPGTATRWSDLLVLARLHRTAFDHLGLTACPKVTGRRGIQIWVPIAAGPSFAQTRDFVAQISASVGAVVPDLVSGEWLVEERGGRARLDYTQNAISKTLVAPYSPRAAAGAPVSAPITWEELDDPRLAPDAFTIRTLPRRLADRGDLFHAALNHRQHLPVLRPAPRR